MRDVIDCESLEAAIRRIEDEIATLRAELEAGEDHARIVARAGDIVREALDLEGLATVDGAAHGRQIVDFYAHALAASLPNGRALEGAPDGPRAAAGVLVLDALAEMHRAERAGDRPGVAAACIRIAALLPFKALEEEGT